MKNALVMEYVKKLEELHKEMQEHVAAEEFDVAAAILEQCQDYAILTGTVIENRAGEGTAVVGCLEDYCEMVYQIYEELQQSQKYGKNYTFTELDTQLSVILNCAKKELDIHMEAVFLPFCADTWGHWKVYGGQQKRILTVMHM